jgi:hypothetical protein
LDYRLFPPKTIPAVGTFQDAVPFVNDTLILALSEMSALFPLMKRPDFVISLGTGESRHADVSEKVSDNTRRKIVLRRLDEAFWEKLRDKQIREAIQPQVTPEWYHRLDVSLDGSGPRLDDTASIPMLKEQAESDDSISGLIDNAAHCLVASLFYFKLDSVPERHNGNFVCSGRILCLLSGNDPAFQKLMEKLSAESAQFLLDDYPICMVDGPFCLSNDGNFRKTIEVITAGQFAISLKRGQTELWSVSGSPFSVESLVTEQMLDTPFGRSDHRERKADHRKRKVSDESDILRTKRRCL